MTSKWDSHVKPKLDLIRHWRKNGLLEQEICKNLGVCQYSFIKYKKAHLELVEALKESKAEADMQIENALFRRAMGFEYTETDIIGVPANPNDLKSTKITKVEKVVVHKRFLPPHQTAQIFYLKNRCGWQDVQNFQHHGKIDTGQSINITQVFESALKEKDMSDRARIVENLSAFYGGNGNRMKPIKKKELVPVGGDN